MTPEEREKELRIIQALLSKTVANGCTEEEASAAYTLAQKRMEALAISEAELGGLGEKRKMHLRVLNIRHPDATWRRWVAHAVAENTGVYDIFWDTGAASSTGVGKGELRYFGNDILVEGAALCAEYLIRTIEALSENYARADGSGQKGRRAFAKGCASRICQRVRNSFNLGSDPNLPLVISKSVEVAASAYKAEMDPNSTIREGRKSSLRANRHVVAGFRAAEHVNLRGHQEKAKLT